VSTTTTVDPGVISAMQTWGPVVIPVVVGLIVGAFGRLLPQWRGIAAWRTLLSAVVGAFLGSKIADFVRLPDWSLLFMVVVAILGILVVTPAYRRKFARS
jgi:uncharacterized membrane protein YeaQ/YmgE (transglycosylase-associated protein family)